MSKWLPDVSPDDRAVDVAAHSLGVRLAAVHRYLKRAAATAGVKDVHQLRVWSRRADAAVSLYGDLLPVKRLRWFRKWLKRLRRAAGRVRDADVFSGQVTESHLKWPVRLRTDRRRGEKKLRALAERLDGGRRFKWRTRRLIDRMGQRHAGATERFGEWARTRLWPVVDSFFATAPADGAEDAALHRFRLRGKELRYAMELLAAAFPPAFRDELYPQIGALQERLGQVNDLAAARRRLEEWLAETGNPATVSDLQRRLAAVGEDLVRARAEFGRWWTPELRESLRSRFDEFIKPPSAPSETSPCFDPMPHG